ncbi:uncharacterized protein V3H82_023383 [Fundulus diaphanus]
MRRPAGVKAGAQRLTPSLSKERSACLSDEEYSEALTLFSIVLQSGLSPGDSRAFGSELSLNLDGQQGVLKRNGLQTRLLSLTRLRDEQKLEALSAFCKHLSRRYQTLHVPGPNLAVKKYRLSYQHSLCSLRLALLCDSSTGFICNMYLYCPEQLQKRSNKPVVEQVVKRLVEPFCSQRPLVQLDSSARTEGRLRTILSGSEVNFHFAASGKMPTIHPSSSSSPSHTSELCGHVQGWTGPALFPLSDLKASGADCFMPGFWATLHVVCINTFVLHSLQNLGSGRSIVLSEFTRALASQLAADSSMAVPFLPRLNSSSYQETAHLPKQSWKYGCLCSKNTTIVSNADGCVQMAEDAKRSSGWRLQNKPGVCGLDNSGNSCYLNAVLQCLCSTMPLVEHLLNQDTRQELAKCKCRVAQVFVRLLEKMWLGSSSSCAPVEARSTLGSIFPQFDNHTQQDAQELLLHLLNALHEDLKKLHFSGQQPGERPGRSSTTESTIVSDLFEGQLSYLTHFLRCGHQAHNAQTFTVLSLPIPKGNKKCSIQDCLSLFFEETFLTGAEQSVCSACGRRREAAVQTCLDKPPEILVLHLKRFGCKGKSQVKLSANVSFSKELDVAPFLSRSAQGVSSYHLYAVVNHTGHLDMGHYTALCYNSLLETWHCFDDALVREVQERLVQSPNAYVLFYSDKPF